MELEELATALRRAGISDPKLFKVRSRSNYYITVSGGENSVTESETEEETGQERECETEEETWKERECETEEETWKERECEKSKRARRCPNWTRAPACCLRAARPFDNRFLYVEEEGRPRVLSLRLGHTDPRHQGVGLFWKTEKFRESRLDFVYSFTNLKYNKSIGVQMEPSPAVTLMSPPPSALSGPDPRVFTQKRTSRRGHFLLQSTVCPGVYLTYNNEGEITLSKQGSPFTERDGTPVCSAENDTRVD